MTLNDKVCLLLKANGFTQKGTAEKLGVHRGTIQRLHHNVYGAKAQTLVGMLSLIGIDVEGLVDQKVLELSEVVDQVDIKI